MPTEIDHNAVKQRIVDILKANSSLFTTNPVDDSKFREIQVGHPNGHEWKGDTLPYVFVSFLSESVRRKGSDATDAAPSLEHDVRYNIWFFVDEKNGRAAEKQLDSFQKTILETLEADEQLKNGGDNIVDTSYPERVDVESETLAKSIQGRKIMLRCTVTTV